MKNKSILIGGLIGGLIPTMIILLIQQSNGELGDSLWLVLGLCFLPGFAAGAIGATALTRTRILNSKQQLEDGGDKAGVQGEEPIVPSPGKGILGGIMGFAALAIILFIIIAIMFNVATGN